uniref:Uncharacterized protein n=1 Tax=Fagus sylvatica TaxID=28930 RepID=A0A2N9F6W1_FAGSY
MGEITHNGLCHALLSLAEIEHELLSLAELHALLSLVELSHAFLMHSSHWPAHALFSLVELSHAFLMHSSHWLAHALFSLVELSHAFLMHNQAPRVDVITGKVARVKVTGLNSGSQVKTMAQIDDMVVLVLLEEIRRFARHREARPPSEAGGLGGAWEILEICLNLQDAHGGAFIGRMDSGSCHFPELLMFY